MRKRVLLLAFLFLSATFGILWQIGSGVQHLARIACEKQCMVSIQSSAEKYAKANDGDYPASCRDLMPFLPGGSKRVSGQAGSLPPNYINGAADTNYLFDFQQKSVEELLEGNISALETLGQPGRVGYGSTTDRKRFVIVGFDNIEHKGKPLEGALEPALILTNKGDYIRNRPGARREKTVYFFGQKFIRYE